MHKVIAPRAVRPPRTRGRGAAAATPGSGLHGAGGSGLQGPPCSQSGKAGAGTVSTRAARPGTSTPGAGPRSRPAPSVPAGNQETAGRVAHLQGGGPRPASPERTGRTRAGSYVTPAPASGRRSPGAEPGRAARASQNATRRVSAAQAWPRPRRPPPPHCHVRRRNARGARIAGPISRPRGRTPAGRGQSRAEEGVGATDQSEVEERALSRGEPIDGRQTVRARASRPIAGEDVGATRNSAASGPTSR